METLGIKELRDNLSGILRRVEEGEIIQVQRHGKGIAELRPVQNSKTQEAILQMTKRGLLMGGSGVVGDLKTIRNQKPKKPISDIVIEDRR